MSLAAWATPFTARYPVFIDCKGHISATDINYSRLQQYRLILNTDMCHWIFVYILVCICGVFVCIFMHWCVRVCLWNSSCWINVSYAREDEDERRYSVYEYTREKCGNRDDRWYCIIRMRANVLNKTCRTYDPQHVFWKWLFLSVVYIWIQGAHDESQICLFWGRVHLWRPCICHVLKARVPAVWETYNNTVFPQSGVVTISAFRNFIFTSRAGLSRLVVWLWVCLQCLHSMLGAQTHTPFRMSPDWHFITLTTPIPYTRRRTPFWAANPKCHRTCSRTSSNHR